MSTARNDKSLCEEAAEYYYEILCPDGAVVPELIARHVEDCEFCQRQISRLRDAFIRTDGETDRLAKSSDNKTLDALSRQFELLGKRVACSHVKPFLPSLLVASSKIRIPTPVTVHVENCPRCESDLAAIEKLGLSDDQLVRLGQFYGQSLLDELPHEEQACSAADSQTESGPDRILRCDEISTADLFDYVLPFGLNAATGNRSGGRCDAIAGHLPTCSSCMERARLVHETIRRIAVRDDSDISTSYRCQDDEELAQDVSEGLVHQYPVHVQIVRQSPASVTNVRELVSVSDGSSRQLRTRRMGRKRRPVLQGTALAAAVVMLVVSLFLANSTATGMSLGELFRCVKSRPNVHISASYADEFVPGYDMWVSSDLNKIVWMMGENWVEYDLNKRTMRGNEIGGSIPLTREMTARCAKWMDTPIGDLFHDVRAGDDFTQLSSAASDQPGVLLSVYELTRKGTSSEGRPTRSQWKAFIDPRQGLPVRIELSKRADENLPWEPEMTIRLSYPTPAEVEGELKAKLPPE